MKAKKHKTETVEKPQHQPYRVRLPGFIADEDVGLGELIKRVTSAAGIKPCGGCQRRANTLNRLMVFSGKR
jgi:hypothetical protein